ncbi:flagellar basal body P-ring formation chaperone FlgA [Arenibaculum pallidiluteum]|uniref:flagellar basal body P-ring formation chaperone FlgA n=1 Tax=Arenibaculum pallidiluteum TaxID=2812559 RepID=UPI001A96028B|nr:flagellar basal body P-ring formation chaperone FlgA [Arenibaculum pallidiluteum]
MKQIVIMVLAAAAFVAAVSAKAATLRSDGEVAGDRITLGDLFEGVGERAGVAVGQAPAPGRRAVFDAVSLHRLARQYGVDWAPAGQGDRIALTRSSNVVGAEAVQLALAEALSDRIREGRLSVELDNRAIEIHLPLDAAPSLSVEAVTLDQALNRFSAAIVAGEGRSQVRIPVSGKAMAVLDVPVLTRRLAVGEAIAPTDIAWTELRVGRGMEDVARTEAQLVGLAVRRPLAPNTPVRLGDLRQPTLVTKGQIVTISLERPGIQLTAKGRALQDGSQGDVVRVVNTSSNRTIEATVTGQNLVAVSAARQLAQF